MTDKTKTAEVETAKQKADTETGKPQHSVPDGCVELAGEVYMRDAQGRLTPLSMIRDQDKLQDQMVRKIIGFALVLSAQIARFRGHSFDDVGAFDALLAEEYGGHARRSRKGNRTYMSYDGCLKVQVQVNDRITFGPEMQIARDLIEECIADWSSDSRQEVRAIMGSVFNVDKEGEISRTEIYKLTKLSIDDERWQRAMDAVHHAIRVIGSKTYIRCYRRSAPDAAWEAITIDLAKAG